MSDEQLSQQLRALRQPAPASDFEARLQQALWREAQSMAAERAPEWSGTVLRLRRWGARMGVGVALSLGATAAAAAGGVWAFVAERTPESSAIEAAPANEMAVRAGQRAAAPGGANRAPVAMPLPPAGEASAAVSSAADHVEAPSAAGSSHAAQGMRAADPTATAQRHGTALPAPAVTRPTPATANADSSSRKAGLAPPPARSGGNPGAVSAAPGAEPAELLQPFDLPERGEAARPRHSSAPKREAAPGRPPRPAVERRPLPDVRAPAEGRRARPERTERGSGAWPPGRAIARERSGRDNADRGLERAREARERK